MKTGFRLDEELLGFFPFRSIPPVVAVALPLLYETTGIDELIAHFEGSELQFSIHASGEGRIAYVRLWGKKETREQVTLAAGENVVFPDHTHGASRSARPYGERIASLAGELLDVDPTHPQLTLGRKEVYDLESESRHRPRAVWWLGIFHQPSGSQAHP